MSKSTAEIRQAFLDFFHSKGHQVVASSSLVPNNDPTLLFTNAGMNQFKDVFLGLDKRNYSRATTSQRCVRAGGKHNDLENVGYTARHHTFFEMLGNFSFGDYFKHDAIQYAWELLTGENWFNLPKERLWVTVYETDDEAYEIWEKEVGIPRERIIRIGDNKGAPYASDNFWQMGDTGPCGPCTEIFYDHGDHIWGGPPGSPEEDGDRYIEIWNIVFMQFNRQADGTMEPLPKPSVDTGMGLERLAVVVQDVDSLFTVDTNKALLDEVCAMAHTEYQVDHKKDVSLRIIADHVKSCTFMISDGIMPSNEGRGYVLRRLIRRAARHGRLLGIEDRFMPELSKTVIELSKDGYPELEEKKAMILKVLAEEEEKFNKTIDQGLAILADMESEMSAKNETVLSGENAFKLYDTYGFPLDLTIEILEEKNLTVDEEGFQAAMKEQREKARKARKTTNYMGADVTVYQSIPAQITSKFVGYDRLVHESEISVLTTDTEIVEALTDGQRGTIVVEETPFYGTMGGQCGDTGVITGTNNGVFVVEDTIHLQGGKIGHVGHMTSGMLAAGETVTLKVDEASRRSTEKNHSATHLLQKALRSVLGDHVEQAGSLVTPDRLRFDFTHFSAMTPEEIKKVEELVNQKIQENLDVVTQEMSLDEAKKTGAMALFGEKYGEKVRVVKMGDFSTELCGGTHVANTGAIHAFKILSEAGIAAGVRRIEALTGDGLMRYYENLEQELEDAAKAAKTTPADLKAKIESMLEEIKALHAENDKLKSKLANESLGDVMDQVRDVKGVKVLAAKVADVDMNGLRGLGDQLKDKLGEGVIVLASVQGDKVNLMVTATDEAQKKGAHAGNLVKAIAGLVGGGGGGRPNMAQAGGKNPAGVDAALEKAYETAAEQIR